MYNQPAKALTDNRSASTKAYFENGLFSTGYATHGLFPYRGKFHPQLIKALINIIGIRKGETILDPMCGSGTANIEAALIGINSYAIDLSPFCQFMTKVLKRYEDTVVNFILNSSKYISDPGIVSILENATAMETPLEDNSIDGVITSPPYSFAIDYVKNDEAQLNFLGYDVNKIRSKMIGLIGKNKNERLKNYFKDMESVCSEVSRVLKKDKYFVMIIGSNTNQTGGVRLEGKMIESCKKHNLTLVKSILKPIKGMRNTMKDEYILFFKKRCGK